MAFHIHVFKHNLLKFTRIRSVSFTTEIIDTNSRNVTEETPQLLSKRGKIWPEKSLMENLASVIVTKTNNRVTLQPIAATQTLPGLYNHSNDDRNISLESLIFGLESTRSSKLDNTANILDNQYLKPVSYTTDDILTTSRFIDKMDSAMLSDTIISQENVSVTLLPFNHMDNLLILGTQSISDENIVLCSSGTENQEAERPRSSSEDGPSQDQLNQMKEFIIEQFSVFFKQQMEYRIYHPYVILENNFWKKTKIYQGYNAYAVQMLKLRGLAHCHYAQVTINVMSVSSHIEDGTIKLRWRVSGLPQSKALMFWRYTPWSYNKNLKEDSKWHDGISTFTLKKDGLVHKHRIDRVMVDEDPQEVKATTVAAKLALLIGLVPKPNLNDFSSIFMKRTNLNAK